MHKRFLKYSLGFIAGAVILLSDVTVALASVEEGIAGFTYDKEISSASQEAINDIISSLSEEDIPVPGFNDIGIANVETNLLIRQKPSESGKILGKLPRHAGCTILEPDKDGWTKVTSGKCTGYVKSEYLITGEAAKRMAYEIATRIATVTCDGLRVREYPSTSNDTKILDVVARGEELIVLDPLVINYEDNYSKWVKVSLDSDDSEDGTVGFVAKEYVTLSYELKKANSIEELEYGSGVSSKRVNLVNFAKKYLGYRYVWGGATLGKGVDCSGFTQQVYKNFGYSIARVSRDQARGGTKISKSRLKPGDLVFYGNSSTGYINHVAIYIGNNKIIHASNRRDGIKISNMNYRSPIKYVRYIND
jgi:uncharacterized protein YgiM (DUF1202 family)